jgi:hypothetical protein
MPQSGSIPVSSTIIGPPAKWTRRKMDLIQNSPGCKPAQAVRDRLPNRRGNRTIKFEHEGHEYLATAGFYPDDGRLAEIFLQALGKPGTPMQENADTAAILASLLLQHGIDPDAIQHSIAGPIAIALASFMGDAS